jgi:hypothetical protein
MRIKKHEKAYIVVLEDGSQWRIWPADLASTLHWLPSTDLEVCEIDDEHCTHMLVDRANGRCIRVIDAAEDWVPEQIEASLVG